MENYFPANRQVGTNVVGIKCFTLNATIQHTKQPRGKQTSIHSTGEKYLRLPGKKTKTFSISFLGETKEAANILLKHVLRCFKRCKVFFSFKTFSSRFTLKNVLYQTDLLEHNKGFFDNFIIKGKQATQTNTV